MQAPTACPVCDEGICTLLGAVDFNKSCEEARGTTLPRAGIAVRYVRCGRCGFCFAPELARWSADEFARRIYNAAYAEVDPDYLDARPRANAETLASMFGAQAPALRHLDYGGGAGRLAELLRDAGWRSRSYDPFAGGEPPPPGAVGFDLITAFEVFEHAPDPARLIADLASLLAADGLVFFSTLVSDGHLGPDGGIEWWYAAPRNGHISLFSRDSLATLGAREGLTCGSFNDTYHAYWRRVPPWAAQLIRD